MRILVEITGVSPLICNAFHDEAAQAATNGTRGSSAAADRGTPREIAEKKLYRCPDGTPGIPQPNMLRSLVDGGQFHKIGKTQVTTTARSMMFSCVDVRGVMLPIIHKQPWRIDIRPVVIPATKGRILAYRPCFDDWAVEFEIELDTTQMSEKLLRAIVDDAGSRIGLGDFRPARKGPFGRYCVTQWREIEQPVFAAAAE